MLCDECLIYTTFWKFNVLLTLPVWNLAVFIKSMRKKSRTDCLLMNQCSRLKTRIGQYNVQTLYQKGRCLRYILRIWWPNIISNKDLWNVTGQEDINLEIRKRKFRWIGHTLRKEDGEVPKAALLWNPQGNRKRGRQKNSWRRSVMKEAGRSWNELRFLAADRQKWKGLIDNLCS